MIINKQLAIKSFIGAFILFISLHCMSSCKKDDVKISPTQQRIEDLSATWILGEVINDDNNVTAQYSDFSLTINGNQEYATQNGGNPWPNSGTFTLSDQNLDLIIRNDGVEVTILEINETELNLKFTISQVNGRSEGVTGQFEFQLKRQQ